MTATRIPPGAPEPGYYRLAADYHHTKGSRRKDCDPWDGKYFPKGMLVHIEHNHGTQVTIVYARTPQVTGGWLYRTDRLRLGEYMTTNTVQVWEPDTDALPTAVRGLLVPTTIASMSTSDVLCVKHCEKREAFDALLAMHNTPCPAGYSQSEWLMHAIETYQAREDTP